VVVVMMVVVGIFAAGSPFARRASRFDEQRISDLQNLQYQAVYFWQQKGSLPDNPDQLNSEISGYMVPRDPENGNAYEYQKTGDLSFKLCANFNTNSSSGAVDSSLKYPSAPYPVSYGTDAPYWSHGKGNVCFMREIDPQRDKLPK
ncbi:MAG: hypothetical protein V1489_00845, partial [Candidatus Liptonbacteria bacterium]